MTGTKKSYFGSHVTKITVPTQVKEEARAAAAAAPTQKRASILMMPSGGLRTNFFNHQNAYGIWNKRSNLYLQQNLR